MTKDKGRASSVKSKEAEHSANMHHPTWNPQLKLDGAVVPWSFSIREFQRGHAHYVAKALERPLLLPKDMDALKHMRQLDLFLFLKRDLASVSSLACFIKSVFLSFFSFLFIYIYIYILRTLLLFMCRLSKRFLWQRSGSRMPGMRLRPTSVLRLTRPWALRSKRTRSLQ